MIAQIFRFVRFTATFALALVAGLVVGLLYAGWMIAGESVKPLFAHLFNAAVGYDPQQPPLPKEPRVYMEWLADGTSINYMERYADGNPVVIPGKSHVKGYR